MLQHILFCLITYVSLTSGESVPTVELEWAALNYTWDAAHTYDSYVSSDKFIVENCLLAGINVDINGDIYVTVPRWRAGVPATLNKIDMATKTLTPYPSWDMQKEGVDGDLQNVQSMTIDQKRRMWTIEVGRRNFFDGKSAVAGPAGLWIIDLNTGDILTKYYFPEDVVSSEESFLNDVVVDESRDIAYFTDAWGDGAIIVFDLDTLTSRRYTGASTKNDPSYAMVINGQRYGTRIFTTPTDGLAMTPEYDAIFYCQVQGTTLYRLPTSVLRNFSSTSSDIDAAVQVLGSKEPSDGMKYLNGELFWGSLTTSAYYRMPVTATTTPDMASEATVSEVDEITMEWIDTFAIDLQKEHNTEPSKLWFTSNRLDQYSVQTMDFSGKNGANMRILSIEV